LFCFRPDSNDDEAILHTDLSKELRSRISHFLASSL
jgi:hypothetical protein